jgi:hypothetical protein
VGEQAFNLVIFFAGVDENSTGSFYAVSSDLIVHASFTCSGLGHRVFERTGHLSKNIYGPAIRNNTGSNVLEENAFSRFSKRTMKDKDDTKGESLLLLVLFALVVLAVLKFLHG